MQNKNKIIDAIVKNEKEHEILINDLIESFFINYIDEICEFQNITNWLKDFDKLNFFTTKLENGVGFIIIFQKKLDIGKFQNTKNYNWYSNSKNIYNNFVNYIKPLNLDDLSSNFEIKIKDLLIKKEKLVIENDMIKDNKKNLIVKKPNINKI